MLVLTALVISALGGCNDKLKKENQALRAQNVELQDELTSTREALRALEEDRNDLLARNSDLELELAQALRTPAPQTAAANTGFGGIAGIEVEQGSRGEVTVRVPGDVLFDPGKVALKNSAKSTLAQIAAVLKSDYAGHTIRVEGYTDADPIRKSKWKDNLHLSAERAMAVYRYLSERGVDADRMYAAGFGASNFRAPNTTPAGKAQNRRVEIVVIMN
jgi:flagellar motor protein MotB